MYRNCPLKLEIFLNGGHPTDEKPYSNGPQSAPATRNALERSILPLKLKAYFMVTPFT
jgi:hypothetical protein